MDRLEELRQIRNALRREEYRMDGGKRKAENKAWKDAHREQVRAAGREYQRLRRAQDPEGARKKQREWRRKNPEKAKAKYQEWYKKHGAKYSREWHAANRKKNPILYMWRNSRNRAKELGIEFTITQADIVLPEFCPVLGIKLTFNHGKNGFYAQESPSVDRFDNTKGYTKENIRIISWRANMLKRDGTLDEFRRLVAYLESCS